MQTHVICYADEQMTISQQLCIKSAIDIGKADHVHSFGPSSIDKAFYNRHKEVLEATQRGGGKGYWLWKPYIVDQAIRTLPIGDTLIYADSGVEFIRPIQYLLNIRNRENYEQENDIFLFSNGHRHIDWCKKEIIDHMLPPLNDYQPRYHTWKQVQASVIILRVNESTRDFVARWLAWSCIPGFVDDKPRGPQLPEFREHRNDQSVLTNLAIKDGLDLHHWPAQYWQDKKTDFIGDDYPQMFYHHRYRNTDWENYRQAQDFGSVARIHDLIDHFMKQPKNV